MTIRKAIFSDKQDLIRLCYKLAEESIDIYGIAPDFGTVEETVDHYIHNDTVFVIEDKNEIVGFLAGVIIPYVFNHHFQMFVETGWYVRRGYRGKSVKLLETTEEYCKNNGIAKIIAGNTGQGDCQKFKNMYTRRGYKLFEQHFVKEV